MKRLGSTSGFTLIESMVVISIIATLTAMAVPTFNRMLAKSRQGQAKAELSGLYTSMKAFFG
ncbi:MAG: type II secretion system GspH family protein [Bdellovibrionales bacterium]|nr:type II secretion system GspH family protein [Bdellovibrionales bacterium]